MFLAGREVNDNYSILHSDVAHHAAIAKAQRGFEKTHPKKLMVKPVMISSFVGCFGILLSAIQRYPALRISDQAGH